MITSFTLDLNMIVSGISIAGLAWCGKTLWKTAVLVERLDERTAQHDNRLVRIEEQINA